MWRPAAPDPDSSDRLERSGCWIGIGSALRHFAATQRRLRIQPSPCRGCAAWPSSRRQAEGGRRHSRVLGITIRPSWHPSIVIGAGEPDQWQSIPGEWTRAGPLPRLLGLSCPGCRSQQGDAGKRNAPSPLARADSRPRRAGCPARQTAGKDPRTQSGGICRARPMLRAAGRPRILPDRLVIPLRASDHPHAARSVGATSEHWTADPSSRNQGPASKNDWHGHPPPWPLTRECGLPVWRSWRPLRPLGRTGRRQMAADRPTSRSRTRRALGETRQKVAPTRAAPTSPRPAAHAIPRRAERVRAGRDAPLGN